MLYLSEIRKLGKSRFSLLIVIPAEHVPAQAGSRNLEIR